ncbi:MAG: calcium/sodium antiporter [Phycisphaerales bacterium]|jgi:cation:H+ antiporter
MLTALLIVLSLAMLTAGAELLVRSSAGLARRIGVSPFVIGAIIVGFGTSTPELSASTVAALRGAGDIAVGNVVGSNIFNVAMVLGVAALIRPVSTDPKAIRFDLAVAAAVSFIPWLSLLTGGELPRWMGVLMLVGLAAFVVRSFRHGAVDDAETEMGTAMAGEVARGKSLALGIVGSVAGLALLVLGAKLLVDAAVGIARDAGLSELVIGLTIVAIGTSLPELVTGVVAALKGHAELALGNVLGSNVFNLLGILGVATIITPQQIASQTLWLDAPLMLGLVLALAVIAYTGKRISRVEGVVLTALWVGYVVTLLLIA